MVSVLPANLISCRVSYFVFVVVTERTSSSRQISEIHVKPFLVKVTLKLSLKHSEYVQLRVKLRVFFFQCHVCFMERRTFYEMGSIQDVRDSTFNQTNFKHDISSYKRICAEFRVESLADFRFMHSAYHGLGNVFIYVSRYGPTSTGMGYPGAHAKFDDEGGRANQGNLVAFIRNVRTQTIVLTTLCPTRQSGSHRQGCHR